METRDERALRKAAVCTRDDMLSAHETGEIRDAPRDQLWVFHGVRRMSHNARNEELAAGKFHLLPDHELMLMARVRRFDGIGPGVGNQAIMGLANEMFERACNKRIEVCLTTICHTSRKASTGCCRLRAFDTRQYTRHYYRSTVFPYPMV